MTQTITDVHTDPPDISFRKALLLLCLFTAAFEEVFVHAKLQLKLKFRIIAGNAVAISFLDFLRNSLSGYQIWFL